MTLSEGIALMQALGGPAFAACAYYLRALTLRVEGVETELRKMNGRLLRLEEWRGEHEKHNAENFQRMREDLRDIEIARYTSGARP